jgi:hypothetical protein
VNSTASVEKAQQANAEYIFAMVPIHWFDLKMSGRQFKVGSAILSFYNRKTGECYPTIETIADRAKVDARHVREDIKALERCGAIAVLRKKGAKSWYKPRTEIVLGSGSGERAEPSTETVTPPSTESVRTPSTKTVLLTDQLTDQITKAAASAAVPKKDEADEEAEKLASEIFDRSIAEGIRGKHQGSNRTRIVSVDLPSAVVLLAAYSPGEIRQRVETLLHAIASGRVEKKELTCKWLAETWDWDLEVKGDKKKPAAPKSSPRIFYSKDGNPYISERSLGEELDIGSETMPPYDGLTPEQATAALAVLRCVAPSEPIQTGELNGVPFQAPRNAKVRGNWVSQDDLTRRENRANFLAEMKHGGSVKALE